MQMHKLNNLFFIAGAAIIQLYRNVLQRSIIKLSHHKINITRFRLHHFANFIIQQKSFFFKFLSVILPVIFTIVQNCNAQYIDSVAVDTISMKNGDSTVSPVANSGSTYDDNDDGFVDTTVKHIYDTSQFFFNWKPYLDESYTQKKIEQRHLVDKTVEDLKAQDDFWYIPAIEKMETRMQSDPKYRDSLLHVHDRKLKEESGSSLLMQPWFNKLLWVFIIGIFIAAVIYFLVQQKINIFSRSSVAADHDNDSEELEDIFHLSYSKLIQQAEKNKDYRIAVRLMFLQLLKSLSDANAIQYQPDYTDLHYQQQLHNSKYYADFSKVCRNYEYVWYGKFEMTEERYASIKNDCIKLRNQVI